MPQLSQIINDFQPSRGSSEYQSPLQSSIRDEGFYPPPALPPPTYHPRSLPPPPQFGTYLHEHSHSTLIPYEHKRYQPHQDHQLYRPPPPSTGATPPFAPAMEPLQYRPPSPAQTHSSPPILNILPSSLPPPPKTLKEYSDMSIVDCRRQPPIAVPRLFPPPPGSPDAGRNSKENLPGLPSILHKDAYRSTNPSVLRQPSALIPVDRSRMVPERNMYDAYATAPISATSSMSTQHLPLRGPPVGSRYEDHYHHPMHRPMWGHSAPYDGHRPHSRPPMDCYSCQPAQYPPHFHPQQAQSSAGSMPPDRAYIATPEEPALHGPATTSASESTSKEGTSLTPTDEPTTHTTTVDDTIVLTTSLPNSMRKTTKLYRCPSASCSKLFTRRYNLQSHLRCHSGERPFVCKWCAATFSRKHDLRRHCRSLHSEDRPHGCAYCSLTFARSDALKRHLASEAKRCSSTHPPFASAEQASKSSSSTKREATSPSDSARE